MAEVVQFRGAAALAEQQELRAAAAQLIAELGCEAGYRIGCLARFAELDDLRRRRLLALADEIERRQGYGWFFAGDDGSPETHNSCRTRPATNADAGP